MLKDCVTCFKTFNAQKKTVYNCSLECGRKYQNVNKRYRAACREYFICGHGTGPINSYRDSNGIRICRICRRKSWLKYKRRVRLEAKMLRVA